MANALFAIITFIAAFACSIFFVTRRKAEGEEAGGEGRRKLLWLTVSLAAAAASAALFMLTQDITRSMMLFDKWSAAFGILAAAGVIAVRFAYAKKPAEA
jgi:peptidoglycan biosynthesis protein MviN/MurJ (putative lipid II flippase)